MASPGPQPLPLALYARLAALLAAPSRNAPPAVVSEEREVRTGVEKRTIGVRGSAQALEYIGPSVVGVGPRYLEMELRRLEALAAAVREAQEEIDGALRLMRGGNAR